MPTGVIIRLIDFTQHSKDRNRVLTYINAIDEVSHSMSELKVEN